MRPCACPERTPIPGGTIHGSLKSMHVLRRQRDYDHDHKNKSYNNNNSYHHNNQNNAHINNNNYYNSLDSSPSCWGVD